MADAAAAPGPAAAAAGGSATAAQQDAPAPAASSASSAGGKPVVLLMVGMAGSGKSTLMQRVRAECSMRGKAGYAINLDPAVTTVPYACNIDIRDTVNYKKVMQQYDMGPNGAIVTSLNLFSTRFDQVVSLVRTRAATHPGLDYVLVDTPGQIEVFAWSASGTLITNMISEFPTVLVFVVDTHRVQSPTTFMATMLYACSVLYKAQLPFIIAFNKTDIADDAGPRQWMADLEAFQTAMDAEGERSGYISSLMRSLGWALDSFYDSIPAVSVSAATGKGMDDLFGAVEQVLKEEEDRVKEEQAAAGSAAASPGAAGGPGDAAAPPPAGSGEGTASELAALRARVLKEALPPPS